MFATKRTSGQCKHSASGTRAALERTIWSGPDFVDLADRMLKRNGTMAFVLPVTAITGSSWQNVRKLWAGEYHDVFVITIADAATENCAFSADTNMAECLVIATKEKSKNTGRASFICLKRCPNGELEAQEIGKMIREIGDIRCLEDGINRGNPIHIGDDVIGFAISAPLTSGAVGWPISRVRDVTAIQSAYQLRMDGLPLPSTESRIDYQSVFSQTCSIWSRSSGYPDPGSAGSVLTVRWVPDTAEYPCCGISIARHSGR